MTDPIQKSIAISLKRMELQKNLDIQSWCCLQGFKEWHSSSWLEVKEQEKKLRKELEELEAVPKKKCGEHKTIEVKDGEQLRTYPHCPCKCHLPLTETHTVDPDEWRCRKCGIRGLGGDGLRCPNFGHKLEKIEKEEPKPECGTYTRDEVEVAIADSIAAHEAEARSFRKELLDYLGADYDGDHSPMTPFGHEQRLKALRSKFL